MKKFDQINVIPFIDIMLVLLTIVLMTASFISQGKIKVTPPKAAVAEKLGTNDTAGYYITVTADGVYYLNDRLVDLPTLQMNIAQWTHDRPVTLKIDAAAKFDTFVQISDLLRKQHLDNVAIVTEKKNHSGQ